MHLYHHLVNIYTSLLITEIVLEITILIFLYALILTYVVQVLLPILEDCRVCDLVGTGSSYP